MSCHSTPGNSAVTSLACALSHTPSDEVSRRFHALKQEVPDTATAPSSDDVSAWLGQAAWAVRSDADLSAWRKERLLGRLAEAQALLPDQLPDAATWHAWQNLRAECDAAHTHAWLAESSGMDLPLTELEPSGVDTKLAEAWQDVYALTSRRTLLLRDLQHAQKNVRRNGVTEDTIAKRTATLHANQALIDEAVNKTEPFEAEYRRRNRWNRYFRVETSGTGHVHSSMSCQSCYPTTQYAWLPALSGKGQLEAVDNYGREMCSHCFPEVLNHPSYRTSGRIAADRDAVRATVDAERAAAKAVKAILAPGGGPLVIKGNSRYPETVKSAVTAERLAVDYLVDLRGYLSEEGLQRMAASRQDSAGSERHLRAIREAAQTDVEHLLNALAHKRQITVSELRVALDAKAAKKSRERNG